VEKRGFYRSAGVVSAAVLSSRVTGLIREMVMARLFGAGAVYDAFLLAARIPNLTRNLFAEGALSSAFVPVFTDYLARKGRREAADLSNRVATAQILAAGALCVAGIALSPALVRLLAPGFARVPGKFELAVVLTRIMLPFLALVTIAAQAMGVLNACDRYGVPAMASTFFNLGSVAVGLALGFTVGGGTEHGLIVSMACGILAGGLFQLLWQLPSVWRAGFAYRPRFDFADPGLRRIVALMIPAVIGSAALQINVTVNLNLASNLSDASGRALDGPVSWLGYAFRFMQFPLGVFGVAIATVTLPAISRSASAARMEEFRATLSRSLGMVLLLTVPSSVGLAVLGRSIVGALFEWGRFGPHDTEQTALALACYSVGLAGYAASKVLSPAFYALDDARTPMLISVASVAVNFTAAYSLVRWTTLGYAGLALSTSTVALFGAVALAAALRGRTRGIGGGALARSGIRIAIASIPMAAACYASSRAIHALAGAGKSAQLLDLAVSIPLGAAIFYAAARALRVSEVEALRTACYTSIRNAPRPEVGDPPARNR
jgi:putative peptidoglycan lipid II flippase